MSDSAWPPVQGAQVRFRGDLDDGWQQAIVRSVKALGGSYEFKLRTLSAGGSMATLEDIPEGGGGYIEPAPAEDPQGAEQAPQEAAQDDDAQGGNPPASASPGAPQADDSDNEAEQGPQEAQEDPWAVLAGLSASLDAEEPPQAPQEPQEAEDPSGEDGEYSDAMAGMMALLDDIEAGTEDIAPVATPFDLDFLLDDDAHDDEPLGEEADEDEGLGATWEPEPWTRSEADWQWALAIMQAPDPGESFKGIVRDEAVQARRLAEAEAKRYRPGRQAPRVEVDRTLSHVAKGLAERRREDVLVEWDEDVAMWLVQMYVPNPRPGMQALVKDDRMAWMDADKAEAYADEVVKGRKVQAESWSECKACKGSKEVPDPDAPASTIEDTDEDEGLSLVLHPDGRMQWMPTDECVFVRPTKPCEPCEGRGKVVKMVPVRADDVQAMRDREAERRRKGKAARSDLPKVDTPGLPDSFDVSVMDPGPGAPRGVVREGSGRFVAHGLVKGYGGRVEFKGKRTGRGLQVVEVIPKATRTMERSVIEDKDGDAVRVERMDKVRGATRWNGSKPRGGRRSGRYEGGIGASITPTGRVEFRSEPVQPEPSPTQYHPTEAEFKADEGARRERARQERVKQAQAGFRPVHEEDDEAQAELEQERLRFNLGRLLAREEA